MQLIIGNKNYSSWSMRPWVLMTEAGIAFEEVPLRLTGFEPGSEFKIAVGRYTPAAKVPVLIDDAGQAVWDTLAIAETLAERHPDKALWPHDPQQRARARSITAEMHSGFGALRHHWPMNIEAHLPEVGARVLRDEPAVVAELARLLGLWDDALQASGGPLLFGRFCIADAFYAPMVMRLVTYGVPVAGLAAAYRQHVTGLPSVRAWIAAARSERDFLAHEEPYRTATDAAAARG